MKRSLPISIFFCALLLMSFSSLQGGIYQYVIVQDGDDGMELDNAVWRQSGFTAQDPIDYMGRRYDHFADTGLIFRPEDLNQGDQFIFARLMFTAAASEVQSELHVLIQGVDADSAAVFSQSNRPSMQEALTAATAEWHIPGWQVDSDPYHYYSPDIAPIINEILARPGWGTGQAGKTVAILLDNLTQKISEVNRVGIRDFSGGVEGTGLLELFNTAIDTFTGGPVLSKPTSDSVSISLISVIDTDFYIEFGKLPGQYTGAIGASQTALPEIDPVLGQAAGISRELRLTDLDPNTRYYYRLRARQFPGTSPYEEGPAYSFITRRPPGEPFTFAFLTDSHVGHGWQWCPNCWVVGNTIIDNALAAAPDFFVIGGDDACTDGVGTPRGDCDEAHVRYAWVRQFFGPLASQSPAFLVLGNHEGEGSFHPEATRECSYEARSNYFYNPGAGTYPFGGGPKENYFAWEWGDALFVCLDVFSYTGPVDPKHVEPYGSGWHLGLPQLMWLKWVLSRSDARWKIVFSHHILASWDWDGYGRGGAKYAHDYEQGSVHQLMRDYGAQIFFYGHDHVFADGTADGIHYSLGTQCFGIHQPSWTRTDDNSYPYFVDAYPGGYILGKGHINVRVHPRSVWIDYVRGAMDASNGEIVYSYHLADVQVAVTPPAVTVIPGDPLGSPDLQLPDSQALFSALFSNPTGEAQPFDCWLKITPPYSAAYTAELQENRTLNPGETYDRAYRINRSYIGQPGNYTFTVEAGDYPDLVISRDSFEIEKLP
jgi:hypothetical protein